MEIYRRIKALRKKNGFTQQEMVEALKLTDTRQYQKYENGETKTIPRDILIKCCELFQCSMRYLIYGDSNEIEDSTEWIPVPGEIMDTLEVIQESYNRAVSPHIREMEKIATPYLESIGMQKVRK